jgi:hypothetical protein
MKRRRHSWLTFGWDASRLGMEAFTVVGLRMGKLATGGAAAQLEAQRMVSEKATAFVEAQLELARSIALGQGNKAPRRVLAGYRKRVRANQRRLTPKF